MAIKQHWVPQFYLRGFATSPGGNKVWVTDIIQAYAGTYRKSKESVTDVAHQSHLYSLPCDDGTFQPEKSNDNGWDDGVDRVLQKLESRAGKVWGQLQQLDPAINLAPGSLARETVATFLASLHLRNPRMVAVLKFAATNPEVPDTQELDGFYEAVSGVPVDLSPTLCGVLDRLPFLAAQIGELANIATKLADLHWHVQYFKGNKAAGPLVTTDTPIFFVDRLTMEPASLDSPDCAVFCPLSSRALLIATRTKTADTDGAFLDGTEEGARTINPFIVHYGQHEAYSGFELGRDFPFLSDAPIAVR